MTLLIKLIFVLFSLFVVQLEALPSAVKRDEESSESKYPPIKTRILGGAKTKQNDWKFMV